jgi:myo-inositol 2-dehydrogenase/D-chiro-inositol 1-dehydrogenase
MKRRSMDTMSAGKKLTRRGFLGGSAAGMTALGLASSAPAGWAGKLLPSEKINMGFIGMGGHGVNRNLRMFLRQPDARAVAVCDVYKSRSESAQKLVHSHYKSDGCSAVTDFRRVLDRKDIDGIMISTPDHWHVLLSVLAIRAGKDVICEKPTLTIEQGRILSDTVKKHKKVFQTSTEDRSLACYLQMAQVIRNGLIGKVRKVEVQLPTGNRFPTMKPVAPPKDLDWDMWIGPAPKIAYSPDRPEREHWRNCFDHSGGKLTDWGMHQLDTVQWALDRESSGPSEVHGVGTINEGSVYNTFMDYDINYRYDDGVHLHVKSGGTGMRFEGTDGWVSNSSFNRPMEASSKELVKWRPGKGDLKLRTCAGGEHRDFLDCVKSRELPYFPAETGHRCASVQHIGNISMLLKRKLKWDPKTETFIGDKEANELRSRSMRAPWSLDA